MSPRYKFLALPAIAASALVGLSFIPVGATPPSGFGPSPLVVGHFGALDVKAVKDGKWDLFLKTKSATDVGVDQLTAQAGGYSGWHSHAGPTLITITEGEVVWYDGEACSYRTLRAGDTFVEPAQRVHFVANETGNVARYIAVQIRPAGAPGRVDEAEPSECDF